MLTEPFTFRELTSVESGSGAECGSPGIAEPSVSPKLDVVLPIPDEGPVDPKADPEGEPVDAGTDGDPDWPRTIRTIAVTITATATTTPPITSQSRCRDIPLPAGGATEAGAGATP